MKTLRHGCLILLLLLAGLVAGCVSPGQDGYASATVRLDSSSSVVIQKAPTPDDDQTIWEKTGQCLVNIAALGAYCFCTADPSFVAGR